MFRIAAIILENPAGELLLYKRDNKPGIPFPGFWDLIGGHIESGENPKEALIREIREELGLILENVHFFKEYLCVEGDIGINVKYIYKGFIDVPIEKITLLEGDFPRFFKKEEIPNVNFANILEWVISDYIESNK